MKFSKEYLIEQLEGGERIKYLFFWGHQPSPNGEVSSSCFSQWWPSLFEVDGIKYQTAEHWMMAEKARLFGDDEALISIIDSPSPGAAKKEGRKVRNFNQEKWEEKRFDIVVKGNLHKFSQHDDLKTYLLNTKERILVEASPRDRIWGIGMGKNNEDAAQPSKWRGLNLLGFALMKVREELRK